jgi:hypothetical protein
MEHDTPLMGLLYMTNDNIVKPISQSTPDLNNSIVDCAKVVKQKNRIRKRGEVNLLQCSQEDLERIAKTLGNSSPSSKNGRICSCPVLSHGKRKGDRNASLSIAIGDNDTLILNCFAGCDPKDVLKEIKNRGLLHYDITEPYKNQSKRYPKPVTSPVISASENFTTLQSEDDCDNSRNKEKALKLWDAASEIDGTLADTYLRKRGIDTTSLKGQLSDSLRFHPSVYHPFFQEVYPCLIAKVTDKDGEFMAIHRIFLTLEGDKIPKDKDGKSQAKLSLGSVKGGAVYLTPLREKIIVTEGIEDALTLVQCCPGYGVLAFLGGNTSFDLPESIKEITIAADNDESGQKLACRIRRRLQGEGKAVGIAYPPVEKDFNEFFIKNSAASDRVLE